VPLRDWKFRIQDILDAVQKVREYTRGMDFKSFAEDRKTLDAVVRNLIIIGEAAVQIPEEVCEGHPEVPWYEMRGMRNFIVHEYFKASDKIIWDTVQVDLPLLPTVLKNILEESME
jgi:uncharacterized protein with HEPN domain